MTYVITGTVLVSVSQILFLTVISLTIYLDVRRSKNFYLVVYSDEEPVLANRVNRYLVRPY